MCLKIRNSEITMYELLLTKLKNQKLINNSKVSPWLERKISKELTAEIISATTFIEVDLSLANRIQTMLLNITEQPKCLTCNNPTNYFKEYKGFAKYCCKDCADKSQEKSLKLKKLYSEGKLSIGKQGVEIQREKYNGLLAIQADTSITEKIKKTCTEKYGVDNVSKNQDIKNKISQNTTGKRKTFIGRPPQYVHFTEEQFDLIKTPDKLYNLFIESKIPITTFSENLNFSRSFVFNLLIRYNYDLPVFKGKGTNISQAEQDICEWLNEKNIEFIPQFKLENKRVDIVIPKYNLAIEYQGIDHSFGKHNYTRLNNYDQEDRNIHLNRERLCQRNNLRLIQIFENEWKFLNKRQIWKSILSTIFDLNVKIYARNCEIRILEKRDSDEFLNENHIQGSCKDKIRLGLYYNNELVSVMTFGKPRFNKQYQYELIRFCNKKNLTIIGGASKLFSYFIKTFNPTTIVSYCDKRIFTGNLYEKLNFKFKGNSMPNYYYFKNGGKLQSRNTFQKYKLKDILEDFNPELSERINMYNNGYRRIWDCGNKIYVYENF